jgi:ribosomal protein L10
MQSLLGFAAFAAGVIFAAGLQLAQIRQLRKDLNGLGAKVRMLQGLLIRWSHDSGEAAKVEQVARLVEGGK